LIEIKDLYFRYNRDSKKEHYVLNGLNLKIKSGEFVSIMGSNGSGKSTLALCIKGILKPSSGSIYVDGIDITNNKFSGQIKDNIGIVFQNPDNQFISTSVEREIAFGLENLGISKDEMQKRISEQMDRFLIGKIRMNSPETLSGGEKQKIALAAVLISNPKYLIIDEATSYLDPAERKNIINLLKSEFLLKRNDWFTTIFITQHPYEALISKRLIVMDKGKIVIDGEPNEVFKNVKELKKIGIRVPVEFEIFY